MSPGFSFILVLIFIFSAPAVFAQEDTQEEVPPGMELITSGTVKILIPKGAKVTEKAGLLILEDMDLYMGRRFLEMEERFADIEVRFENLKASLENLEAKVGRLIGQLREGLDKVQAVNSE